MKKESETMNQIINDEKFNMLLKKKQNLEMLNMLIPFLSIIALLIFLYLFTTAHLVASLITLGIILILVIGQYAFDSILSNKIDVIYLELVNYFEDEVIPVLLKADNAAIHFDSSQTIDPKLLDQIELFKHFKTYNSRYHYENIVAGKKVIFDEVLFDQVVGYNTVGQKELDPMINKQCNYHFYQFHTEHNFKTEAMFIVNQFEELSVEEIAQFSRIHYGLISQAGNDYKVHFYIKDSNYAPTFMKERFYQLFRDPAFQQVNLLIYFNEQHVTVVIEEFEKLINPPRSKRYTVEKLLHEYHLEQDLLHKIIKTIEYLE